MEGKASLWTPRLDSGWISRLPLDYHWLCPTVFATTRQELGERPPLIAWPVRHTLFEYVGFSR